MLKKKNDDIEISSDSDRENSDEENFNEKNFKNTNINLIQKLIQSLYKYFFDIYKNS